MKTNEGKHNGEEQNRQQAGQVKAGAGQGCGLLWEANATRGNRPTPGAQLPEAEQKEHQGGHNAGKTTGNTTATKGCLLQASRLQQVAATGKTQRVHEKWWVYVG